MDISVNQLTALYILYGLIQGDRFGLSTKTTDVATDNVQRYYDRAMIALIEELEARAKQPPKN